MDSTPERDGEIAQAKTPLRAAAALLGALLAVLAIGARGGPLAFDAPLTDAVSPLGNGPLRPLLDLLNILGTLFPWLLILIATAVILRAIGRPGELVLVTALLAELASYVIKMGVGRERPDAAALLDLAMNESFPSGHVVRITVLMGAALLVLRPRGTLRLMAAALVVVSALLMGVARIVVGAHYPSDVLGGTLLSALVLVSLAIWTRRQPRPDSVGR